MVDNMWHMVVAAYANTIQPAYDMAPALRTSMGDARQGSLGNAQEIAEDRSYRYGG